MNLAEGHKCKNGKKEIVTSSSTDQIRKSKWHQQCPNATLAEYLCLHWNVSNCHQLTWAKYLIHLFYFALLVRSEIGNRKVLKGALLILLRFTYFRKLFPLWAFFFEMRFWTGKTAFGQFLLLWCGKWPILGVSGGTENGTSGAQIKILRPLFNTNTPPKTPI